MAEYTYSNIIIDPTKEGIESLIGKEVYFHNNPYLCLDYANKKSTDHLGVLAKIRKNSAVPFTIEQGNTVHEHTCIIVKKEPCYEDQVKQWIEENNIKVGNYVKVTRRAENHADGLDDYWYDLMRDSVGKILKIKEISNFIMLDNGINYPYFVLEKVEEPPKPKYVPFESKEEFIDAFHYHDNAKYSETEDILLNYGMWLWSNEDGSYKLVTENWNAGVVIGDYKTRITNEEGHIDVFNDTTSWVKLFSEYRFLDGSHCGKEVEDE